MSKKSIVVESVPLLQDTNGNVAPGNLQGAMFELKTETYVDPESGETRQMQTYIPSKVEMLKYSHKAPEDDAYIRIKSMQPVEGCTLKFRLQDSPHQTCPEKLPVGEFTLLKNYDFKLEFSDKPITFEETGIPDNLEYKDKLHSPFPINRFKKQRDLFWYLINRRGFYSDFIWHKLEHPPELQKTMTLKALMERKRQILQEQEELQKNAQKALKSIEKELRDQGISPSSIKEE
jgi:hypothetical protein